MRWRPLKQLLLLQSDIIGSTHPRLASRHNQSTPSDMKHTCGARLALNRGRRRIAPHPDRRRSLDRGRVQPRCLHLRGVISNRRGIRSGISRCIRRGPVRAFPRMCRRPNRGLSIFRARRRAFVRLANFTRFRLRLRSATIVRSQPASQ